MEEKYTNIKERVLYLAKNQGFSVGNFLTKIDMTYGSFKGKAKEGSLNSNAIAKILTIFPKLNMNWLILGEGDPFQEDQITNVSHEPSSVYSLQSDNNKEIQQIPLYNLEASAGLVQLFQDHKQEKPVDYISVPNLPKCDGAIYVTGDSMYPLLKSGDIIIYKENQLERDMLFMWGEMYLISIDLDGDDYVTVKWVQKSEKGDGYIKLVSQNQHHQPIDVKKDKIRACAMVKASIRINAMN